MRTSNRTPVPWLSGLLLVACIASSMQARVAHDAASREARAALATARGFFTAHPYLDPGLLLEMELGAGAIAQRRQHFERERVAEGRIALAPAAARRQQQVLDAVLASAHAQAEALPARGVAVAPGEGVSLAWLAYALQHPSAWHLAGNGLLLLLMGVYLERTLGRAAYAATAAAAAFAGAAAWRAAAPQAVEWGLVGTTPLLAGLVVLSAIRLAGQAKQPLYVACVALGGLWLVLPPAAGAGWSFADLGLASTLARPAPTSVYWACAAAAAVGGAGAALAWLLAADGALRGDRSQPPLLRRALRARRADRPREALELLEELLRAEPDLHAAALAAWELQRELGHVPEAAAALVRVIRIELKEGSRDVVLEHWSELAQGGISEKADPILLLQMALLLRESGRPAEAVHALRCALERTDDRAAHVVAARIARVARGLDAEITEAAVWRALGSLELAFGERQALETLLGEVLALERDARRPAPRARAKTAAPPTRRPIEPPARRPIEQPTRPRALDLVLATPLELTDAGLEIQTDAGAKKLVRPTRIQALAVAAVQGLSARPVLIVDLVLDWNAPPAEPLRVIRLRSDRFDPRALFPGHAAPVDALRSLVKHLLDRSRATPLPDAAAAVGRPFVSYDDLGTYHATVLGAGMPEDDRTGTPADDAAAAAS